MSCWKQKKNLKLSLSRRVFIFFLGFIDNVLFGGAIFGWPQLVYVLKADGVFSHLCDSADSSSLGPSEINNNETMRRTSNEGTRYYMGMDFSNVSRCVDVYDSYNSSGGAEAGESHYCAEQDQMFALIHTVAVVCYGTPGVFLGFLLHYVGIRITRMVGGFLVSVSFICLALTTAESSFWLFPAAILLSVGGNAVRMSGMQFGDLFPTHRSTTITVLMGVYAASASLFYLFYIAQETGVPRSLVCAVIGSIACISALCSFFIPPHHIPHEEEKKTEEESLGATKTPSSISLMETFRSMSSMLVMYWFFVLLFCVNVYQLFYNVWVTASTCTEEEAGLYSSFYSFSNLVSVFCAPVGGMFTDYLVRKAKRSNEDDPIKFRTKEVQANFFPLFFTTFFGMMMFGCLIFFHPAAIIVSLMCMIVVRPSVVAISTAYIRIRFPADHFNRLLGIYCTFASLMMYFQYPVFQWSQHMYYMANGFVLFLIALSFANPFHLLCTSYIRRCIQQRDRFLLDGSPVKMLEKSS